MLYSSKSTVNRHRDLNIRVEEHEQSTYMLEFNNDMQTQIPNYVGLFEYDFLKYPE